MVATMIEDVIFEAVIIDNNLASMKIEKIILACQSSNFRKSRYVIDTRDFYSRVCGRATRYRPKTSPGRTQFGGV